MQPQYQKRMPFPSRLELRLPFFRKFLTWFYTINFTKVLSNRFIKFYPILLSLLKRRKEYIAGIIVMIPVIIKNSTTLNFSSKNKDEITINKPPDNHNFPASKWVSFQIDSLSRVQGVLIPIK